MSYTAFIPARSGSKRLPNKNVKLLAGKPLLVWTLEACHQSNKIDEVVLSTDSEEYWNIAKKYFGEDRLVLDYREPDEAGDTVKIFDYLKDKKDKIFGNRKGEFILALPTVPLRRSRHVDEAIDLYEKTQTPVFSATSYGFSISFAFRLGESDGWEPVFDDSPMLTGNTRSQNQKVAYHPNGAIYVRPIEDLSSPGLNTLYQGALPYIMDRASSVDIDSEIDFKLAESLL